MGCVVSTKANITSGESGTEAEFKERFVEEKVLGEGEFGVVKLISEKSKPGSDSLAVKILNKGFTFKDNTLYPPMKPEILRMEIDILHKLGGSKYNLFLHSVFESPSKVFVVTELCSGGEMLEYTSKNMSEGLRTEDVSRMAFQLLSAVDHCDRHNIVHRDIKPQNIMFKSDTKTSELRLIDFGCATMDEDAGKEHATFAGTPFYISPEMFQKQYTTKTDVFSVGVTLYILVGGYPAADLQAAFNILQKSKRDLKTLPGMPEDMPDSYYVMLDKLLAYKYKGRKSAGEMLDDDFVLFHQALAGTLSANKRKSRFSLDRTQSMVLRGTAEKAAAAHGYSKFQRSVTTIIATMLSRDDIKLLISRIEGSLATDDKSNPDANLGVIKINDLKALLVELNNEDCVSAIGKQKHASTYEGYAYDYTLLRPFANEYETQINGTKATAPEVSGQSAMKAQKTMQISARNLSSQGGSGQRSFRKLNAMSRAQSVFIRGI